MPDKDAPIYLLAGPTASGKSAKALAWAQATGGLIVNADSMQLYADVPTLTARPDAADMARAEHVLYGHLGPDQLWSTGDWLRAVTPYIDEALNGGRRVCIVGGTGLYFNSLTKGLADIPDIEDHHRTTSRTLYEGDGEASFRAILKRHDPAAVVRILPGDRQRLTRAYEVFLQTGVSLSDWQSQTRPALPGNSYTLEILQPDRAWLYERCRLRLEQMLAHGALDEVRDLMQRGLQADWPIMRVLGLSEFAAHLRGEMAFDDAFAMAWQRTRNYAKRQMTWFRNQYGNTPPA